VNSVGDAFGFAFRDPKWVQKILIQGLILIIPIIGLIALAGWMLMTFDNIRAGRQELATSKPLVFGQSITDGCLGWEDSAALLATLAEAVRRRRARAH